MTTKELQLRQNLMLADEMILDTAAGTARAPISDLTKVLTAGNLKMPGSDETIEQHYRYACNRNLLINWYFGNPVNQRGQDSYSIGYGLDYWKSDGATDLNDGSATFSKNFYQKIPTEEFKKRFLGKQLTLSALYADGTLEFGTLTVPTQYPSAGQQNQIVYATPGGLGIALTTNDAPQIFRRQTTNKGVVAVKTELGPHQTLAHKEGSKWILNEIPDYAVELAKCQIYQRVYNATNLILNGYISNGGIQFIADFPPFNGMRSIPAVSFSDLTATIRTREGYSEIAGYSNPAAVTKVDVRQTNYMSFEFGGSEIGPNNTPASAQFRTGKIILDANL